MLIGFGFILDPVCVFSIFKNIIGLFLFSFQYNMIIYLISFFLLCLRYLEAILNCKAQRLGQIGLQNCNIGNDISISGGDCRYCPVAIIRLTTQLTWVEFWIWCSISQTIEFMIYTPHMPHATRYMPHTTSLTAHAIRYMLLPLRHMPHGTCYLYMPHVTRYIIFATCPMSHATCHTLLALHYMPHGTWYSLHSTRYMLLATCYMPHTTYLTLHSTRYLHYATCHTVHDIDTCHKTHSTCSTLHATWHTVHDKCYMPYVTRYILFATSHMPQNTCYSLHVTCHTVGPTC